MYSINNVYTSLYVLLYCNIKICQYIYIKGSFIFSDHTKFISIWFISHSNLVKSVLLLWENYRLLELYEMEEQTWEQLILENEDFLNGERHSYFLFLCSLCIIWTHFPSS